MPIARASLSNFSAATATNAPHKKSIRLTTASSISTKLSSLSANVLTNHSTASKLNVNGKNKLQYITDSIWSYNPEYTQFKLNKKLKEIKTKKKTKSKIKQNDDNSSYFPNLSSDKNRTKPNCYLHSTENNNNNNNNNNFFDETHTVSFTNLKLPDLNPADLDLIYPPPSYNTYSDTPPSPNEMNHNTNTTNTQHYEQNYMIRPNIISATTTTTVIPANLNRNQRNQSQQQQQQQQRQSAAASANLPRTSHQVYSNLIESRRANQLTSQVNSNASATHQTSARANNSTNRNSRKKTFVNITSSYAIENDNFVSSGYSPLEIHPVKQYTSTLTSGLNSEKENDDYYDYLELKHQLFQSSLKTPELGGRMNEDISPARQRLNNLNKNLHAMIQSKRQRSAASNSSANATNNNNNNINPNSLNSASNPAAFFDDAVQLLECKQPQVLNMKFKPDSSIASTTSQKSKSKPGSASTYHSSIRSANSNKSNAQASDQLKPLPLGRTYDTDVVASSDPKPTKIVIYGKNIENITAADLLSVLSEGINKKMLNDETKLNIKSSPVSSSQQHHIDLNKEIEKRTKANMEFFEFNYDEDFDEFAELDDEEEFEEDLDYEDEFYYEYFDRNVAATEAAAAAAAVPVNASDSADDTEVAAISKAAAVKIEKQNAETQINENELITENKSNEDGEPDNENKYNLNSARDAANSPTAKHTPRTISMATQVNFDTYDDDKPIDPARYRSIKKTILVSQSQAATAASNERRQTATLQPLNAQKRLKTVEQRKFKQKIQPTLANTPNTNSTTNPINNTNSNSNVTMNARIQRIKSAKSDRVLPPTQPQLQQTTSNQPESQQNEQEDPHLQRDYINKQNKLILNKIKNYSKNTQIEEYETLKMQKEFTNNYFDAKHEKEKNRFCVTRSDVHLLLFDSIRLVQKCKGSTLDSGLFQLNEPILKYADVINDEFRQVLNKYDSTYTTADQFIRQQLPPPEYYLFQSPAKESDNNYNINSNENNSNPNSANLIVANAHSNASNNATFEMYNLLKRMMVKKKYVMHTIRQENINTNARLRMKRLFQQQQQQQQQQTTNTSTANGTGSPSSSAQLNQPSLSAQVATNLSVINTNSNPIKTRPSTAAVNNLDENNEYQTKQQQQLTRNNRLNRPKTANIIPLRPQNQTIVDLSNYEVVSSIKQQPNQLKLATAAAESLKSIGMTNNNMAYSKKMGFQSYEEDNSYYEQFRLSPTTMTTQAWPYELDFDRYVKRRNLINRLKAVKLVPYKKLPLVKIELLQQQQQQLVQQPEVIDTNSTNLQPKHTNLKNRPLTAIRTSAAALLNNYKQVENEMNRVEMRRSISAKQQPLPTTQPPTRSLIKITFNDEENRETIEDLLKNDVENNDAYLTEADQFSARLESKQQQIREERVRIQSGQRQRSQTKKSVSIDDSANRKSSELKIPICTCQIMTSNNLRPNQTQAIVQPLSVSMLQFQNQRRPNNLTKMNIDHMQFKKLAMQHQEEIYSLLDTSNNIHTQPNQQQFASNPLSQVVGKKGHLSYHFSDVYEPPNSHLKLNTIQDAAKTNRTHPTTDMVAKSGNNQNNNVNLKIKINNNSQSNSISNNPGNDFSSMLYKQANAILVKAAGNNLKRPKTAKV